MKIIGSNIVILLFTTLIGCGGVSDRPELGYVEGTVTMDGKPVPNATVIFQKSGARPSAARTDKEGYYELVYTDEVNGVALGTHKVFISTFSEGDPDQDIARQKEMVPAKYNNASELTSDVVAGSQVLDFKLESGGDIVELDDSE